MLRIAEGHMKRLLDAGPVGLNYGEVSPLSGSVSVKIDFAVVHCNHFLLLSISKVFAFHTSLSFSASGISSFRLQFIPLTPVSILDLVVSEII